MSDTAYKQLWDMASQLIDECESDARLINTVHFGNEMHSLIDPDKASPLLVEYASIRTCVQIVGKVCRERFGSEKVPVSEDIVKQHEMFGSRLQARYPAKENGELVYKRLEDMSHLEVNSVVGKLMKLSQAYVQHADQLSRYASEKFGFRPQPSPTDWDDAHE